MSELASQIDRGAADVLAQMAATSAPVPDLVLESAAPLVTLSPDLVALVVGRVQAGASALGTDHPRTPITRRIVLPSAALAVLDAVGLVSAAVAGHTILAVIAAFLLAVLAYLAFAGVRFVRSDPLRVRPEQRARVDAAKAWRSGQNWTDDSRSGPWGRLVDAVRGDVARIAAGEAWAWPSIAQQRAGTELAHLLDDVDAEAFALAPSTPIPSLGGDTGEARLVRRAGALRCYADALDDLVRRAATDPELRNHLSPSDDQRLNGLLALARPSESAE